MFYFDWRINIYFNAAASVWPCLFRDRYIFPNAAGPAP